MPIWGLHHVVGRDGTRCFDLAGVAIASATHRFIFFVLFENVEGDAGKLPPGTMNIKQRRSSEHGGNE